jgi:hypothetical protein
MEEATMFRSLTNSWALAKASASVLSADKELVIFPIISAVALVFVTGGFLAPLFLVTDEHGNMNSVLAYVLTFLFYVVSYFVIFFCNSALVGAALIRLRGGDPTVSDGFRIAFGKVGLIFGYSVIAATVGLILRAIQERAGFIGKIVTGIVGVVWSLATFLVVPVLVSENVGPVDAVKRSAALLKQTWGEQVTGNFAVSSIIGLAGVVMTFIFIPLFVLAMGAQSGAMIGLTIGSFIFCMLVLALINATLSGIYTAAVYRYAAEGVVGQGFDPAMVQQAFRAK